MEEPTDTGSTVAAGGRHECMRGNASHRGRGARRRRVEPPEAKRSLGDERERAETDLVALHQNSAQNHDQRDRKNRNFSN